jgi:hypothetical protein
MNEPLWIRSYRIAFALLALAAVIRRATYDDEGFINYLSKFTYQSNTFAALVLLGGALLVPAMLASTRWDLLRGAALMYLVTTFVVYGLLVNSFDNPFDTTRHWTHTVLHQVIPVVVVLDFLIRPFANRLSWRSALVWTIYPLAFFTYSLVRGSIIGWYPYDFIDPNEAGGWDAVALNTLMVTVGFLLLGALLVWISHLYRRPVATPAPVQPQGDQRP